jgi:putative transposase
VHHSDRGIQYASAEYVAILRKHEMVPSMSRPANPYDNASCESFIKTLKREEIYANEYQDLDHLRSNIAKFIERYYNQVRLHSALGYRSPEEFEEQAGRENSLTTTGATVRFFLPTEEKASTLLAGEGTQTPSLPQTPSCLRINGMTARNRRCCKV